MKVRITGQAHPEAPDCWLPLLTTRDRWTLMVVAAYEEPANGSSRRQSSDNVTLKIQSLKDAEERIGLPPCFPRLARLGFVRVQRWQSNSRSWLAAEVENPARPYSCPRDSPSGYRLPLGSCRMCLLAIPFVIRRSDGTKREFADFAAKRLTMHWPSPRSHSRFSACCTVHRR